MAFCFQLEAAILLQQGSPLLSFDPMGLAVPDVDGFTAFMSEELGKDHGVGLTLYAPEEGRGWEALGFGLEGQGETLNAALNQLAQRLDFTSKDLRHDEEPSRVKRVAELAQKVSSPLVITCGDTGWHLTVPITEKRYTCTGGTLDSCLQDMMNNLLGDMDD